MVQTELFEDMALGLREWMVRSCPEPTGVGVQKSGGGPLLGPLAEIEDSIKRRAVTSSSVHGWLTGRNVKSAGQGC